MTSPVAAELDPPDACPQCHPGDHPACIPLASAALPDGTVAAYLCEVCGCVWVTVFDRFGWTVKRSPVLAPLEDAPRKEAA
jgi:hypothetical protein